MGIRRTQFQGAWHKVRGLHGYPLFSLVMQVDYLRKRSPSSSISGCRIDRGSDDRGMKFSAVSVVLLSPEQAREALAALRAAQVKNCTSEPIRPIKTALCDAHSIALNKCLLEPN